MLDTDLGAAAPDARLKALGLLDARDTLAFDRLTTLAAEMIGAPVSLVSVVLPQEDRQYFKSFVGLPAPLDSLRQTPLSHSFCRHVRASGEPLIVADARSHPLVHDNLAVRDLGVIAYLGMPIHGPDGAPIGAFCAMDGTARAWTAQEIAIIAKFARIVDDQIGLLAALQDRDRALAAEREATLAKTRFLATVSHELRTPLCGILGMAELLEADIADPAGRTMAGTIRTAGQGLMTILNDLLDMSKIEFGKMTLDPAPFDVAALAAEVAGIWRPLAEAKGLAFVLDTGGGAQPWRLGDGHRLRQVLNNLLGNALKFTGRGRIGLAVTGDDPGMLRLRVFDTGIGMSPEAVERLFRPFEQADSSIARRFGGTGLGMAIVAGLVAQMQGRILVSSAPGEGTDLAIDLPLAAVPRPGAAVPAEAGADIAGLSVLAADDNATNRHLLSAMLGRAGVQLVMAEDGAGAVALAAAGRFDAVLLDINMPGIDGVEAMRRIRADAAAEGRAPPRFVAISANVLPEQVAAYHAAGFDAHLGKPFTRAALTAALQGVPPSPNAAAAE